MLPRPFLAVVFRTLLAVLAATACQAATNWEVEAPEQLVLDRLGKLYGPVHFDHQLHADYAACVECHHHTTGAPPSDPHCLNCHDGTQEFSDVSCSSCHAADPYAETDRKSTPEVRYHLDIPGLKGAYHLSCLGCHQAVGAGPTECADCHQLTPEGEAFYRTGLDSSAQSDRHPPLNTD